MGSRSKSRTQQTENTTQNIDTRNLNLSDFEGTGIADVGGDVSIVTTDLDALEAAGDFSRDALDTVSDISTQALTASGDVAGAAVKASRDLTSEGFGFASDALRDSLDFSDDITETSFDALNEGQGQAFDFAESVNARSGEASQAALNRAFAFGDDALTAVLDTTQRTTSTLGSAITQAANATRSDASEVLSNITRYGAIAIAVIGVALLLRR